MTNDIIELSEIYIEKKSLANQDIGKFNNACATEIRTISATDPTSTEIEPISSFSWLFISALISMMMYAAIAVLLVALSGCTASGNVEIGWPEDDKMLTAENQMGTFHDWEMEMLDKRLEEGK
jgi:hypothetical protein